MNDEIKSMVSEIGQLIEAKKSAAEAEKAAITANRDELNSEVNELKESIKIMEKQLYRVGSESAVVGDEEVKAFSDFLRTMDRKYLRTDVDIEGGYLVPQQLHNEIVRKIIEVSPMRALARVVTISGRGLEVPAQDVNAAAYWVGEGGTNTQSHPNFNKIVIPAHKAAVEMKITQELLGDAAFDMGAEIVNHAGRLLAAKEGAAFINGTGINQPQGILQAAGILNVNNGAGTFSNFDSLMNVVAAFKYNNPVFVMNRATLAALRKLKDTTNQYLFGMGPNGAMPMQIGTPAAMLLGIPVMIMQDMPDIGAGTKPVALIDANEAYMIVDRLGVGVRRDDFTLISQDMVKFVVNRRVGGAVVQPDAVVTLTMS